MRRALAALTLAAVTAGGTTGAVTASASHGSRSTVATMTVVTLGDSVPRGTNCGCTAYPVLVASRLATKTGHRVTAANDSVAGYTTRNVLRQLSAATRAIADVRRADAVAIEIGANDIPYSASCGPSVACYAARIAALRERLSAIVSRVRALAAGRQTDIVLLDYWSIWLGGRYAAAKGSAYVTTAREMTARVNAAIRSVATETHTSYVDLRAAFKGRSYAYDETHYLSSDGDHPNAAGHARIAAAAEAAVQAALHL